jgi:hypothetical protein
MDLCRALFKIIEILPFCTQYIFSLYPSPIIMWMMKSRRMRCAWHVTQMGAGRGVYRVLVGKPEGKRPLERPRHRWEDNI